MPHRTYDDAEAGYGLDVIPIGFEVEVRRWDVHSKQWPPWRKGTVVGLRFIRCVFDNDLHVYTVDGDDDSTNMEFMPFLGELRHPALYNPSDDHSLWMKRLREYPVAYASIRDSDRLNFPAYDTVWQTAVLLNSHVRSLERYVVVLAGPLTGSWRVADTAIEYLPQHGCMIQKSPRTMLFDRELSVSSSGGLVEI